MENFILYKKSRVHFTDTGQGNVVVLLHGFLENCKMWRNLAPIIAKTHRVVCIDLLGHGQTGNTSDVHSMQDMAQAVKVVIDHLSINQVILIGHSMGGYVSLAFAKTYPSLVTGLCLMNSTAAADTEEKKKNRDRAIDIVRQNNKLFVRRAIPNLFAESNRDLLEDEIKTVTDYALQMPTESIVAALKGMKQRSDNTLFFQKAPFKKIMIIGRQDPVLNCNDLMVQTKNTDIHVVELDGGHMSHIENIEEFTYNITHFIEKL